MADMPPIKDDNDYKSDVFTNFESEIFHNITSLSTE